MFAIVCKMLPRVSHEPSAHEPNNPDHQRKLVMHSKTFTTLEAAMTEERNLRHQNLPMSVKVVEFTNPFAEGETNG